MNKNAQLFLSFFKIGLFTFGGGIAMLPLIEKEAVQKHQWIDEKELINMVAIAESTPGPIAINSATYVGNRVGGILGAVLATLAVVLPSFAVIVAITFFIEQFMANQYIRWAFFGIRACVAMLILNAVIKLYRHCPKTVFAIIMLISTIILSLFFFQIPTMYLILGGIVIGIMYYSVIDHIIQMKGNKNENTH